MDLLNNPPTTTVGLSETFARLKSQRKVSKLFFKSSIFFFNFTPKKTLICVYLPCRKVALIPYITAGDPDLSTTAKALKVLDSCGSDIIELGVPYSDPLADGPAIQVRSTP